MVPSFTLKTAATTEPVTVADAIDHCRAPSDVEVGLIQSYITAARLWVEAYTQRSLSTQTWQLSRPTFVPAMLLPRAAPLQSVTHVKYYDADNALQTLSATVYTVPVFQEPASLWLASGQSWPSVYDRQDAVQVEYVTGYAAGACPDALRLAMLTLVAHYYEHREALLVGLTSQEVEFSVTALCAPYRLWWTELCA